jgi:hypothetical protein
VAVARNSIEVDRGISLGLSCDPHGNGLEAPSKLPRERLPRQEQRIAADIVDRGEFPGSRGH